jgi:hypothetical protein
MDLKGKSAVGGNKFFLRGKEEQCNMEWITSRQHVFIFLIASFTRFEWKGSTVSYLPYALTYRTTFYLPYVLLVFATFDLSAYRYRTI